MSKTDILDVDEFREKVRLANLADFQRHTRIASWAAEAITQPRPLSTCLKLALDMLCLQGFKSHSSVGLLLEHAHTEDAATVVRRLLELAVQAIYIGGESEAEEREARAGTYLAALWEEAPPSLQAVLLKHPSHPWEDTHNKFRKRIDRSGSRWGPSFKKMFEAVGQLRTYKEDYAFLSKMSHGSVVHATATYAATVVELRADTHAPILLEYANRYFVAVLGQWNEEVALIPPARWGEIHALALEDRTGGGQRT